MIGRSMLLALSWGIVSIAPLEPGRLPQQLLPVYGGSGGTAFTRTCGAGKVMTGVRFRAALLVDAVGILCRPVQSDGTLGSETTVGTVVGGSGGTTGTRSCPAGQVVTGQFVSYGTYVNGFTIRCEKWTASNRTFDPNSSGIYQTNIGTYGSNQAENNCEARVQPVIGIRGRSHSLVDALGFICDEP